MNAPGPQSLRQFCWVLALCLPGTAAATDPQLTGLELMQEVHERHRQYPHIYEEQSMVMVDRAGERDSRKVRRYSRVEDDGSVRFLLLFESPPEVKGVAILANRDAAGEMRKSVYLPAYGEQMIESSGAGSDGNFLGTDFSVESLTGERLADYRYVRRTDQKNGALQYYVVDVYPVADDTQLRKRHYIRDDNFYITQTDYFDSRGRVSKKQTHHDLKAVDGDMWRANLVLMEDKLEQHQSLIKIHRRVFSRDYVPAEMFSADWLFANHPHTPPPVAEGADDAMVPLQDNDAAEEPAGE